MDLLTPTSSAVTEAPEQKKVWMNGFLKESNVLRHRATQMLFTVPQMLATDIPATKPSAWFALNAGKKPTVIIPKCNLDLLSLAGLVKKAAIGMKLTADLAICFLRLFYETVKSEAWKSYGVTIGAASATFTPLSLVDVIDGPEKSFSTAETSTLLEGEINSLALYILAVYRLLRINHQTHSREVITRTTDVMKGYLQNNGTLSYHLDSVKTTYSGWAAIPDYAKMVAVFDMFMFKQKTHPLSVMRIATVSTRFRDCAGLTSIQHLASILGYKECARIGFWCFSDAVGDDYLNLFTGNEELDKQDSYFPYQVDLGLTEKSAYSSTVNQTMYYFVHAVGALCGSKRSSNALYLLNKAIIPTTNLAVWVALIHSTADSYKLVFDSPDTPSNPNLTPDAGAGDPLSIERPTDLNFSAWFNYLADRNFKFAEQDLIKFKSLQANMGTEFREGTIGEYISTYTITTD